MKQNLFKMLFLFWITSHSQKINYELFKGDKVSIVADSQLDKPYFLDYNSLINETIDTAIIKPINSNIAEKVISDKQINLINRQEENNYIRLYSKLTFFFKGEKVSIIKYKVKKGTNISSYEVIQVMKKSNNWIEIQNNELKNISYLIRNIRVNVFWEFYNKENNPEYPEINKLKPLVKDSNGVLNIEKLAQVIEENKNALSKYMDN